MMAERLREGLADVIVHDEVDVTLTIAGLLVREAMELLGQRADGLGEQAHRLGRKRKLTATGADHVAGSLDDIAEVELT